MGSVAAAALPAQGQAAEFRCNWPESLSRPWPGPEYWSNPLQDWRVRKGRLECIAPGGDRNVFLLTREIAPGNGDVHMTVRTGRLEEDRHALESGFVGFRTGSHGHFRDYRDSAVRGIGLDAGVTADGTLFVGTPRPDAPKVDLTRELVLRFDAQQRGSSYAVRITAADASGKELAFTERTDLKPDGLIGGIALVCSSGPILETPRALQRMVFNGGQKNGTQRGGTLRFWFRDWTVAGSRVRANEARAFGPILFAMHTLSRGVVKLTAQLAPVETTGPVRLEIRRNANEPWRSVGSSGIDPLSRTATFRLANWDDTRDTPYRIVYAEGREHHFEGTIRRDPRDKSRVTIGALTCNNDFGFPHEDLIRGLKHFAPDLLLFTGDQIYERVAEYGIQMAPLEGAVLDYLRKWYLFGWSYRDLLRDIPAVAIPDDHDMYHGNIWGAGGRQAEQPAGVQSTAAGYVIPPGTTKAWQDTGGYKMPAAWVNAVQRTQTSHLPDPFDPSPVEQGIGVYYTSMLYGGVSFAILEDRKWKSSPTRTVPSAKIENGWAQNPKYDAARDGDVPGAQLLGERQLAFLEKWAADWSGGARLKIVVSQTLFANLATLPPPANNDDVTPKLPVLRIDEYPKGEVKVQDHDSNGWPQTPRNLALRAIRKSVTLHVGGDQHLGSTVQYGIDEWNDGPWALCTPAISNLFPRRWYPPEPGRNRKPGAPVNTGEFVDGFGNKITVHAVANPAQFGVEPAELYNRAPGYGIVVVEHASRKLTMANWPRWVDPAAPSAKPYAGWPITIDIIGGPKA